LTKALAWTAAALFAASWFLPVLEDLPGWMAFRYALGALVPFRAATAHPSVGRLAPQLMSALTNVVFIILFALWASSRVRDRPVRTNRTRVFSAEPLLVRHRVAR
jgi:hypothetical protein